MSPRLSLAHSHFGIWLIRTGRKLTDRGFAIVEFELSRWSEAEGYMTEAEESKADMGILDSIPAEANPRYPQSSQRAA